MLTEQQIHIRESMPRRTLGRILCPTDLTQDSDHALRYAVALARTFGAKLYVCYAVEKPDEKWHDYIQGLHHIKGLFEESLGTYLSEADKPALEWEGLILEGSPSQAICREAAERDIDLIVMNSRRRPIAAALLGSTAESVIKDAPCPVFVTHAQEQEWVDLSDGRINLRRILVGYDLSEFSEQALAYGLSLAQEFQSEIHMLHVMPPFADETLYPPEEGPAHQIARRMQYAVPAEAANWCEVKQEIRSGVAHREILAYAEEEHIDLICIGAHGEGFNDWTLFGSNVDRVLRQARCPVLVARARKAAVKSAESGS